MRWQAFLFPLLDIDSVNSPRARDKVLRGMCKHYGARPPSGPKHCFSAVYLGAMATHHGVDDCTYPWQGAGSGFRPTDRYCLGCAGLGGDLGVAMCAGHQLLPGMHALTCPLSHRFPEKTMARPAMSG